MISIVCVYNNEQSLKDNLLKTLEKQTSRHELILVDNRQGKFKSAAKALNYGGARAKGDYVMFSHQDVVLTSDTWLEDVEEILDGIPKLGIAGCAGRDEFGNECGFIKDGEWVWGEPLARPEPVQVLDEVLLIIPQNIFSQFKFDENLEGWHAYGADYCLTLQENGLQACVIPAFIWHNSLRTNIAGLEQGQKQVWIKHRANFPHIYTTCGTYPRKTLIIPSSVRKALESVIKIVFPLVMPSRDEHLDKLFNACHEIILINWRREASFRYRCVPLFVRATAFRGLPRPKRKNIYCYYISAEIVKSLEFEEKSFDGVGLTLEILTKLSASEALELVRSAEKWARNKIVIFGIEHPKKLSATYPWLLNDLGPRDFEVTKPRIRGITTGHFLCLVKKMEGS